MRPRPIGRGRSHRPSTDFFRERSFNEAATDRSRKAQCDGATEESIREGFNEAATDRSRKVLKKRNT